MESPITSIRRLFAGVGRMPAGSSTEMERTPQVDIAVSDSFTMRTTTSRASASFRTVKVFSFASIISSTTRTPST